MTSKRKLPFLRDIERLSPLVTRILGQNGGPFTLQGTNTYLVGNPTQNDRILIDTGIGEEKYTEILRNYLEENRLRISTIIVTHWHIDHYGGLDEVLTLAPDAKLVKHDLLHPLGDERRFPFVHIADKETLEDCGVHLTAYFTPGHCDDHISLWLREERVLFSGDNLLGHGSSVFNNYLQYMHSLVRMRDLPELGLVYPGHGEVVKDGKEGFQSYIDHRMDREKEILSVLQEANTPLTNEEIMRRVYKDSAGMNERIRQAALSNTVQYLEKLSVDGKVRAAEDKWASRAKI